MVPLTQQLLFLFITQSEVCYSYHISNKMPANKGNKQKKDSTASKNADMDKSAGEDATEDSCCVECN